MTDLAFAHEAGKDRDSYDRSPDPAAGVSARLGALAPGRDLRHDAAADVFEVRADQDQEAAHHLDPDVSRAPLGSVPRGALVWFPLGLQPDDPGAQLFGAGDGTPTGGPAFAGSPVR